MFSLPTTQLSSDTGVSSVRVDEFAPVSTVNADGGGTVAFECTSPANSFWCPRLSYFNFRLKVTSRKADGTAEALTSTDATAYKSSDDRHRAIPVVSGRRVCPVVFSFDQRCDGGDCLGCAGNGCFLESHGYVV